MVMSQQYPAEDLYIYQKPTFNSVSACIAFVQAEANGLILGAKNAYQGRGVDNIYCVEDQKLEKLIKQMHNATDDVAI